MCNFSQRLSEARKNANMTQADAADKLGINKRTIAAYEAGAASPQLPKLVLLADIYNVSIDYLFGRAESDLPNEERDLLKVFRALPVDKRQNAIKVLQALE